MFRFKCHNTSIRIRLGLGVGGDETRVSSQHMYSAGANFFDFPRAFLGNNQSTGRTGKVCNFFKITQLSFQVLGFILMSET